MSLLQSNPEVKIKEEILEPNNYPDNYKSESEPLTEPSE